MPLANNEFAFATDGYEDKSDIKSHEGEDEEEEVVSTTNNKEILVSKKGKKIICYDCGETSIPASAQEMIRKEM
eukprot:8251905-Ditylum_brightwellii.AAC.1